MYEHSVRPFLIRSLRENEKKEQDIIEVLHLLDDLGFRGRLQLTEFSIILQTDYDTIEVIKLTFPERIECREMEFLERTVH